MANIDFTKVVSWTISNGEVSKVTAASASTSDKIIWSKSVWADSTYWNPQISSSISENLMTFLTLAGCETDTWVWLPFSPTEDIINMVNVTFYKLSNQNKSTDNNYVQIYNKTSTNKNVAENKVRIGNGAAKWEYMSYLWDEDGDKIMNVSESSSGAVTSDRKLRLRLQKTSGCTHVEQTLDDEYDHGDDVDEMQLTQTLLSKNGVKLGGKLRIGNILFSAKTQDGDTHNATLIPITDGIDYAYRLSTDSIEDINKGTATKYFYTGG